MHIWDAMYFHKQNPPGHLAHVVKEFWVVENPDPEPRQQKIVPDGYCEIVIHYGDPYRIKLYDTWETQEDVLLSGQISRYFFLENTGVSAILGIKLMPAALYGIAGIPMSSLTDKVVPLKTLMTGPHVGLLSRTTSGVSAHIDGAIEWMTSLTPQCFERNVHRVSVIADSIIAHKGLIDIESLAAEHDISRRHLEREFKMIVGLNPKYFARIIQFSFIFEAMQSHDNNWVDVALNSGYFDQSHFIRNFKAFTGESPAQYGFDRDDMANFFLRR